MNTETYSSPKLTPALHLKLFLVWTKNRKTTTHEMARSFSGSREYDYSKPAIIGINLTFMLLSIVGNLLATFFVSRTPSLRWPSTTLLCGLAASDVIVGLSAASICHSRADTKWHPEVCGILFLLQRLWSFLINDDTRKFGSIRGSSPPHEICYHGDLQKGYLHASYNVVCHICGIWYLLLETSSIFSRCWLFQHQLSPFIDILLR